MTSLLVHGEIISLSIGVGFSKSVSKKDQNYDQAIFAELGSAPATMEAGKAADAMGLLKDFTVEISDAEQAYTQALLGGDVETWVSLPRDQWPQDWIKRGMRDPVCPLVYALYGLCPLRTS